MSGYVEALRYSDDADGATGLAYIGAPDALSRKVGEELADLIKREPRRSIIAHIDDVQAPRGKGNAFFTNMLNDLRSRRVAKAFLIAYSRKVPQASLIRFYARHGFALVSNRNEDAPVLALSFAR